jgi:hypothetical protein
MPLRSTAKECSGDRRLFQARGHHSLAATAVIPA